MPARAGIRVGDRIGRAVGRRDSQKIHDFRLGKAGHVRCDVNPHLARHSNHPLMASILPCRKLCSEALRRCRKTTPFLKCCQELIYGSKREAAGQIEWLRTSVNNRVGFLVWGVRTLDRFLDESRLLELAHCLLDLPQLHVDPSQVDVRKVPGLVAWGILGFLEPRNRFLDFAEVNEIRADVVVGVAKVWIDLDRLLALVDGVIVAAEKGISPSQKGMCLGGRTLRYRILVQLERGQIVTTHLLLIGGSQQMLGSLQASAGFLHVHRLPPSCYAYLKPARGAGYFRPRPAPCP